MITVVENITNGVVVIRALNRARIIKGSQFDISNLPEAEQRRLQHELEDLIKRGFLKQING